jgi:isoleucyl-tRNA synthetase
MSTILENRPPSLAIFGHGSVLAEDGRQMHKSWGNAIWFDDAVESMGADVMRWMYLSSRPESNMRFGLGYAEEVKRSFLLPLWNVYGFFVTYASLDQWKPKNTKPEYSYLDKWIISKLQILIREVTEAVRDLEPQTATTKLSLFVDGLSKWYVRRSRKRFWKTENDRDKEAAYATLYSCLTTLSRLLAPFVPFVSEELYQNLVRCADSSAPVSVHLTDWPVSDQSSVDYDCMKAMDLAMAVSRLGHAARDEAGIKVRQPLARAVIAGDQALPRVLDQVRELVADELNVKRVDLVSDREELFEYRVRLLPRALGAKYGKLLPKILQSMEAADQSSVAKTLRGGESVTLRVEEKEITLGPADVEVIAEGKLGLSLIEDGGLSVGLDTVISESLRDEGLVRDIIRRIQNQRKEAGFSIADSIETYYRAGPKLTRLLEDHKKLICAETLSKTLTDAELPASAHVQNYEIGGEKLELGLTRA